MRPEILALSPFPAPGDALTQLEPDFVVHRLWQAEERPALIERVGPTLRALVLRPDSEAAELIARLPKLEIVASFGVGYLESNIRAATERGVPFTNTPDVLTDDVADLAIGLMIATMRRIPAADAFLREGKWGKERLPFATRIAGKRLGILGLGRIGRAIGTRAVAMRLTVAYHGPRKKPSVPYRYYDDLAALAADSDILIVACPGNAATNGLVNRAVLDALGPNGFLVNIARGSVVDEPALIEALRQGRIAGAGLDVFADEPNVPAALKRDARVVLTPHMASATAETRIAMANLVIENLRAHFAGRPLPTQANAEALKDRKEKTG